VVDGETDHGGATSGQPERWLEIHAIRVGVPAAPPYPVWMRKASAVALDTCLVLAFVIIGRASHHDGDGLAGLARTAWPFLTGLAVGEVVARSWRRPAALVPTGVVVWLSTVAIGMTLRVISGQGTVIAFIAVALGFLGLFLLGWRVIVGCVPSLRRHFAVSPR
jgi:Protein of unknown function (DUF3054)